MNNAKNRLNDSKKGSKPSTVRVQLSPEDFEIIRQLKEHTGITTNTGALRAALRMAVRFMDSIKPKEGS